MGNLYVGPWDVWFILIQKNQYIYPVLENTKIENEVLEKANKWSYLKRVNYITDGGAYTIKNFYFETK